VVHPKFIATEQAAMVSSDGCVDNVLTLLVGETEPTSISGNVFGSSVGLSKDTPSGN